MADCRSLIHDHGAEAGEGAPLLRARRRSCVKVGLQLLDLVCALLALCLIDIGFLGDDGLRCRTGIFPPTRFLPREAVASVLGCREACKGSDAEDCSHLAFLFD